MPTESDLRDLFRGPDGGGSRLDTGEIIRRAHRRRTPKVLAASAGALLVVAAVVVPVASLGIARTTTSAGSAADGSTRNPTRDVEKAQGLTGRASPDESACGAPAPAPSDASLGASVEVADTASGSPLAGTLVLRGSDAASEVSITGPVTLTLLRGDDVVWSGTTDLGSPRLSLAAGGEARLPFTVRVVDCGSGGAVAAGDYRVVAGIPVSIDGGTAERIGGDGEVRIS